MTAVEKKAIQREIKIKFMFGIKLSPRQRSYYLLYMATREDAIQFIQKEKK